MIHILQYILLLLMKNFLLILQKGQHPNYNILMILIHNYLLVLLPMKQHQLSRKKWIFYGHNNSTYYHTVLLLQILYGCDNSSCFMVTTTWVIFTQVQYCIHLVYQHKIITTIFISLLCLHSINHGSVLYLIFQILLYNQQYIYDEGNNNSVSSVTVTSAVTMKITSCESYVAAHSVVSESLFTSITALHWLFFAVNDRLIPAATIMTTFICYYHDDDSISWIILYHSRWYGILCCYWCGTFCWL